MNKLREEFCKEKNVAMGLDSIYDYVKWLEQKLALTDVENNEVALQAFVEEYVEAFENGQGSDTSLYRQAKNLLLLPTNTKT